MSEKNKTELELLEDFIVNSFVDRKQKSGVEPIWKHSMRVGKQCMDFISKLNLDNDKMKYVGYVHDILHDTKTTEQELAKNLSSIFEIPENDKRISEIVDVCKKMNRDRNQEVSDFLVYIKNTNDDVLYIVKTIEMNDKLKMAIKNYTSFKERWNYCIVNSKKFVVPMLESKIKEYDDSDKRSIFSELKFFFERAIDDSEFNFDNLFCLPTKRR